MRKVHNDIIKHPVNKIILFSVSNVHKNADYIVLKLDNDLKLNGYNDISIASEYQTLVPRDKTLGWAPTRIIGKFYHGVLTGISYLQTNVTTFVYAMTKKGILHGPCVIRGISYLIEPVSFNASLIFS